MKKILISVFLVGLLITTIVVRAGTNTLSSVSGGKVQTSHINQYYTAINQDLVPRNSSGSPTSLGGSLGTSTYKWLLAKIESGYWKAGDLKMHHTFNGTVYCGQGWMLADGRTITESNYDAETGHTTGDWDIYVVSSSLDGKYLPNMTGKYAVGKATTTQNGSSAITGVGNTSHQINIAHTHTEPSHDHTYGLISHNHRSIYETAGEQYVWQSNGSSLTQLSGVSSVASGHVGLVIGTSNSGVVIAGNAIGVMTSSGYTENSSAASTTTGTAAPTTNSSLSSTQSVQPESIEVQYCMRVAD